MNPHIIKHFSFTTWLRRRWPVVVAVAGALAIVTLLLWGYFETRTALDLTGNTEAPEVGEEALPSDPPSGGDERARDKLPREPGDELSNDGSPTSPLLRDSARPSALAPLTGGSTPAPVSSPPSASPRPTLSAPTPEPPEVPPTLAPESAAKVEVEEEIELDAIAQPPPLLLEVEGEIDTEVSLSNSGILAETNSERARLGLSPLRISSNLNAAATLKVIDMFARQYFEHTSPTGVTISDLSESVGYDYILVGENLALGNFSSDAALVAAWMGSPGHRANIQYIA